VATAPRRFFVVHLQKTAGTALRDRLRSTFGAKAIYPNGSDGDRIGHLAISLSNLLERWQARRNELRVIAAHLPLSTVELLDADFVALSVLRPPVERTISYLRHQKQLNEEDSRRTLEEVYDDPFRFHGLIRNHMTRMFSIGAEEMIAGDGVLTHTPDTTERLERAKEGVASLDAFGLQPRFEEFCEEIAARFGLDLGSPRRSNVTRYDETPSSSLVKRIEEDNALDMELYEFAEQLHTQGSVPR
jgi:Sulfotransferase family